MSKYERPLSITEARLQLCHAVNPAHLGYCIEKQTDTQLLFLARSGEVDSNYDMLLVYTPARRRPWGVIPVVKCTADEGLIQPFAFKTLQEAVQCWGMHQGAIDVSLEDGAVFERNERVYQWMKEGRAEHPTKGIEEDSIDFLNSLEERQGVDFKEEQTRICRGLQRVTRADLMMFFEQDHEGIEFRNLDRAMRMAFHKAAEEHVDKWADMFSLRSVETLDSIQEELGACLLEGYSLMRRLFETHTCKLAYSGPEADSEAKAWQILRAHRAVRPADVLMAGGRDAIDFVEAWSAVQSRSGVFAELPIESAATLYQVLMLNGLALAFAEHRLHGPQARESGSTSPETGCSMLLLGATIVAFAALRILHGVF